MTRESRDIIAWEYSYNTLDCIKNMKKYGIGPALSHDWERTKGSIESKLDNAMDGVVFGIAACVAVAEVPLVGSQIYRFIKQEHKRQK